MMNATPILATSPSQVQSRFLLSRAGRALGSLGLAPWREAALLRWEGAEHRITKRRSRGRSEFLLEREGEPIARAFRRGWLFSSYRLELGDRVYELAPSPAYQLRNFDLRRDGECLGTVGSRSEVQQECAIDFPESFDPVVQSFVFALTRFSWRRAQTVMWSAIVLAGSLPGLIPWGLELLS